MASTASAQRGNGNLVPWKPGQSGNPRGRQRGSRNKLCEEFIGDLYELWNEHGPLILRKAAQKNPVDVVKAVIYLMPKSVKLEHDASQAFVDVMRAISEGRASAVLDA